ncbi:hypothetical protein L227DRAFT_575957 [Lentinus tigrinus ALCF2SS1-6]|uniref:DUF6533 domain-containing protein n=1 Tax=Lentinus tigrinus ALCF2SS1-6 TaxID=1328759 RepID=A0A5C2SF42_9APHY|nr:hypothetical protein L227DRAFT_575957 [Lentinus tigrinus ALCF2SS1-6]
MSESCPSADNLLEDVMGSCLTVDSRVIRVYSSGKIHRTASKTLIHNSCGGSDLHQLLPLELSLIFEVASVFESVVTSNYCGMAAMTLIGCEYLALLPREIELFWKRRVTGASVLFLSNRYLSLLSQVIQLTNMHLMSDKSCANLINAIQAIFLLPYFPWAVFSGLRTYALCGRRLRLPLGIFVFLLSSVSIGVNFARYRWLSSAPIPMLGCVEEASASAEIAKGFTIASRTCLIAADLIVIGVTWRATYHTTQLARAAGEQSMQTFAGTVLRDGTIYFLVLLTLNTLHLLFTMLSISSAAFESVSYVSIFTDPITSALVSRFILNLQEVNQSRAAAPELTSSSSDQSSIKFMKTRILGSLGSTLPLPGDNARELEDDWDGLVFKESDCGFHEANGQEADTSRYI